MRTISSKWGRKRREKQKMKSKVPQQSALLRIRYKIQLLLFIYKAQKNVNALLSARNAKQSAEPMKGRECYIFPFI